MKLATFLLEDDAVTAIEYGLISALIAVAIIVALTTMGTALSDNFAEISVALDAAI